MQKIREYLPEILGVTAFFVVFALSIYTAYMVRTEQALFGAPIASTFQKDIIPITDSTYILGTSTKTWLNVFTDQICLSADCRTAWPSGGGSGVGTVSTSTTPSLGGLAYWTSAGYPSLLGTVATGTVSGTNGITVTANRAAVGGALAIDCTVASGSAAGCLSSADWTTFNNKGSGTLTAVTATYPIQSSGGTTPVISTAFGTTTHQIFSSVYLTAASTTNATTTGSLYITPLATVEGTFLAVDPAGRVIATTTPSGATGANPTGTIGLTAVNGSALTFLRSDAAPALSQAIVPTWTGLHLHQSGNGNIVAAAGAAAAAIQVQEAGGGQGGVINFGNNTASIGVSSDGVLNGHDYDGAFVFRQLGTNPDSDAEFIFQEEGGEWRFVLPTSGVGKGTYNPRSMIIAGPATSTSGNLRCASWGFLLIDCDTSGTGADLGVQDDLQVLGTVYSTLASTTLLSVHHTAYFGGTATTTIDSAGTITGTSGFAHTFPYASSTAISVSGIGYFGTASTTNLTVSSIPNALVLTATGGVAGAYAGTSCSNQLLRSISSTGAGTCSTVGAADVSLANLTATDTTLTFSGTYTGATARTIGLNLGNANTWTALQQFQANASTTRLSVYHAAYFGTSATTTISATGLITVTGNGANTFPHASTTALSVSGNSYLGTVTTGLWNGTQIDISSYTNLTAGRSLTLTGDDIAADAELYTDSRTFNYASSTYGTSTKPILYWLVPQATTIATVTCWAGDMDAATSSIQFEERTTPFAAGTDVLYGTGILAGSQQAIASSTLANSTLASGSYLAMMVEGYLLGTPNFPVCNIRYTYDD